MTSVAGGGGGGRRLREQERSRLSRRARGTVADPRCGSIGQARRRARGHDAGLERSGRRGTRLVGKRTRQANHQSARRGGDQHDRQAPATASRGGPIGRVAPRWDRVKGRSRALPARAVAPGGRAQPAVGRSSSSSGPAPACRPAPVAGAPTPASRGRHPVARAAGAGASPAAAPRPQPARTSGRPAEAGRRRRWRWRSFRGTAVVVGPGHLLLFRGEGEQGGPQGVGAREPVRRLVGHRPERPPPRARAAGRGAAGWAGRSGRCRWRA